MAVERNYYTIDPEGKLTCNKCKVPLVKGKAKFMYLENGFPVEMPVCPKCDLTYSIFWNMSNSGKEWKPLILERVKVRPCES